MTFTLTKPDVLDLLTAYKIKALKHSFIRSYEVIKTCLDWLEPLTERTFLFAAREPIETLIDTAVMTEATYADMWLGQLLVMIKAAQGDRESQLSLANLEKKDDAKDTE
jgi:hypothetical protein